ncbi:cytoskeleton protein RodZ [Vibrio penaeicida]|uniref:Transcriptional regulator n=1 Tax=Vibrio penaeicida TaxID=104609 RepID=A0AAV5NWW1_9VIBR|nr:cytoskeleton protein RodZ [Vibrio penaeicida]RTZ19258.1 cytoskeleton protein RodZ [Vibrio penaeicida]GLQ74915.1 transcriptional regulator [Vibrio penaeicida]
MSIEQTAENMTISTLPLPGDVLRQQREKLGLTQKDIADRLRLRLAVIQNIEDNNFKSDQVATFTRGYLRSYAKAVGLSDDDVLPLLEEEVNHKEQSMQSFSRKTNREKHDSRIMLITWGVLAVLVGISSVWWWQNQSLDTLSVSELTSSSDSLSQESEADLAVLEAQRELNVASAQPVQQNEEVEPTANAAVSTEDTTSANEEVNNSSNTESSDTDSSVTDTATSDVSSSLSNESSDAESPESTNIALSDSPASANPVSMSFSADCWIQVKDAEGKVLATGVKKAGHQLSLSGKAPYSVILGAPEGVSMTFAGEAVDLSGYTAGKVARFKLP